MTARGQGTRAVSRRSAVQTAGLAALAAGLGAAATPTTAQAQPASVSGVIGTWRMRFSPGPGRTDIQVIFIFIPGGVFISLDSPVEPSVNPADPPGTVEYPGPNAGQWLQLPTGDVKVTALQFNYDLRAVVTSEEVSQYALRYDGTTDTIAGMREWRETTPDGRLLLSAIGPIQGTRVRVEV